MIIAGIDEVEVEEQRTRQRLTRRVRGMCVCAYTVGKRWQR